MMFLGLLFFPQTQVELGKKNTYKCSDSYLDDKKQPDYSSLSKPAQSSVVFCKKPDSYNTENDVFAIS